MKEVKLLVFCGMCKVEKYDAPGQTIKIDIQRDENTGAACKSRVMSSKYFLENLDM